MKKLYGDKGDHHGQQKLVRGPPAIIRVIFYNVSVCYSLSSCVGDG